MSSISAVIFDLDDTLYAERDYAFSGFDAVARAFDGVLGDAAKSARRMRELFDSPHRRRVFNQILRESAPAADAAEIVPLMVDTFRSHPPTIGLPEESERVLDALTGSYRLGIITDGPAVMQRAKLNALGLAEVRGPAGADDAHDQRRRAVFDAIIVTDELGPAFAKPRSAAFELIAERLGVEHAGCTYVADNPAKDFVAPNALGWLSVRLLREDGVYADAEVAPGGAPQVTIPSLDELPPLLLRISADN